MHFHEMSSLKIDAQTYKIKSQAKAQKWISDTWESAVRLCSAETNNDSNIVPTEVLLTEEQAVALGVWVPPLFYRKAHVGQQVLPRWLTPSWIKDGGGEKCQRGKVQRDMAYCACAESERRLHWMSEISNAFTTPRADLRKPNVLSIKLCVCMTSLTDVREFSSSFFFYVCMNKLL